MVGGERSRLPEILGQPAPVGVKSAILLQQEPVDPKFQLEGVAPHQPFFFSINQAKLSFVRYKNLDRSFFRFVTIHACDRQTDRRTDGRTDRILIAIPRLDYMQHGKNRFASVCVSVCAHSHDRISGSIFTKIGTDKEPPKVKTSSLSNIAPPIPPFCPRKSPSQTTNQS